MLKVRHMVVGLSSAAVVAGGSIGVVSAATNQKSGSVGTSGIPQSVFRRERLDASAQTLNTTTANIQAAHKNKTFKSLVTGAGLTKQTYQQKLQAQLTTDLEGLGYTQQQVNTATSHKHHVTHERHSKKA